MLPDVLNGPLPFSVHESAPNWSNLNLRQYIIDLLVTQPIDGVHNLGQYEATAKSQILASRTQSVDHSVLGPSLHACFRADRKW